MDLSNHTKTLKCKSLKGTLLQMSVLDLKKIKDHPETWDYMAKTNKATLVKNPEVMINQMIYRKAGASEDQPKMSFLKPTKEIDLKPHIRVVAIPSPPKFKKDIQQFKTLDTHTEGTVLSSFRTTKNKDKGQLAVDRFLKNRTLKSDVRNSAVMTSRMSAVRSPRHPQLPSIQGDLNMQDNIECMRRLMEPKCRYLNQQTLISPVRKEYLSNFDSFSGSTHIRYFNRRLATSCVSKRS